MGFYFLWQHLSEIMVHFAYGVVSYYMISNDYIELFWAEKINSGIVCGVKIEVSIVDNHVIPAGALPFLSLPCWNIFKTAPGYLRLFSFSASTTQEMFEEYI